MRIAGFTGGVLVALMGGVWMLQGMGSQFAPQSFMTGSEIWIVIGGVTLFAGGALAWRYRPRK